MSAYHDRVGLGGARSSELTVGGMQHLISEDQSSCPATTTVTVSSCTATFDLWGTHMYDNHQLTVNAKTYCMNF